MYIVQLLYKFLSKKLMFVLLGKIYGRVNIFIQFYKMLLHLFYSIICTIVFVSIRNVSCHKAISEMNPSENDSRQFPIIAKHANQIPNVQLLTLRKLASNPGIY